MKTLNEEIDRMKQMMGVINENTQIVSESQLLVEGVSAGKRCWYYKQIAEKKFLSDERVPNPYEGAGGVQDFLIAIGWNILKDWDFGNQTAKALGTWRYGAKSGIDTVNKLWQQLKKQGYDVGETTGYGPKMLKAVGAMIVTTCTKISKTCEVDAQTVFDMSFKLLPEEDIQAKKVLIPNTLNSSFKYAINYWRTYLKTPAVQKKIWSNMSVFDFISNITLENLMDKYFSTLNIIEKKGWIDNTTKAEEIGATMYVNGDCPEYAVCTNMDVYFRMYKNNGIRKVAVKTEDTFVHEIQHILWRKVQKLNSTISIRQAFPSSFDYYGTEKDVKNLSQSETIPADTKKELEGKGIDYDKLKKHFSGKEWTDGYNCDWNEKLSNLSGYRSYLTDNNMIKMGGDISLNIISEHIKGLLNYNKVSTDFERMIACWVLGGMKPKLSLFVKELNDLAQKEKKPEDKDFSDPSQIDKDNVA
jgi:hypothetical protein